MSFQQLYYTSCERGLSGSAGYQFNAVSPGVAPQLMRDVEALSAYEPPRSQAYPATQEELDRCPVNLCLVRNPDATVLASVTYLGQDFSQRFGNYFVHALATATPEVDLHGVLPIELWRAPLWRVRPVDSPELPELPRIPDGSLGHSLGHRDVAHFVQEHPHAAGLAGLLTAAAAAIGGTGRSVLVVEQDSDAAARWIAALCYLLPPGLTPLMSFATYQRRPVPGRLHVYGTVQEVNRDLGAARADMAIYDFCDGVFDGTDEHPAARLLSRAGVGTAIKAWRATAAGHSGRSGPKTIAAGHSGGSGLDRWYPLIAVALMDYGVALVEPDVDAVLPWLASTAGRADPARVAAVGDALLRQPGLTDDHLPQLIDAARAAHADGLWERAEQRLADADLSAALATIAAGPRRVRQIVVPAVRASLAERCTRVLDGGTPGERLVAITWAADAGLACDPDALFVCGTAVAMHLDDLPAAAIDAAARRAEPFRQGIVAYFADLAQENPSYVLPALGGRFGGLLRDADLDSAPYLREVVLVHRARQDHSRTVDLLFELVRRSGSAAVETGLLAQLRPNGLWTLAETRRLVDAASSGQIEVDEEVMVRLILQRLDTTPSKASLADYLSYCRQIAQSQWFAMLPEPDQAELRRLLDADARLNKPMKEADLRTLVHSVTTMAGTLRLLVEVKAAPLLLSSYRTAPEVAKALVASKAEVRFEFLANVRGRTSRTADEVLLAHIVGLILARVHQQANPQRPYDAVLHTAARLWSWPQLERLAARLAAADPAAAKDLRAYLRSRGRPRRWERVVILGRKVSRLLAAGKRRAAPDPPAAGAGETRG